MPRKKIAGPTLIESIRHQDTRVKGRASRRERERARRIQWFDCGAGAFARACPGVFNTLGLPPEPLYVCPLCITAKGFTAYRRQAVDQHILTDEDVPLKKLGGRPLLLTCKDCNHTAGSQLDAEAVKADRISKVLAGSVAGLTRARLTTQGISISVDVGSRPGQFELFGCPDHTSPRAHAAFFKAMGRVVVSRSRGWALQLEFPHHRVDLHRAALSWLRSAYLAAFAKFGYRLILGRAYGPVRESIREPEPSARVGFLVVDRELRSEERRIVVAGKPAELAGGLLVQMGQHVVALPGPNDVDFYDRLSLHSSASRGEKLAWEGMAYDWPRGPELLLDAGVRNPLEPRNQPCRS